MDKKIIQELIAFVEGHMSIDEFKSNYETNKGYKKLFNDKKPFEKNYARLEGSTVNEGLQIYFEGNYKGKYSQAPIVIGKLNVWHIIKTYLEYYNIPCTPTTKYEDDVKLRHAIQPSYVEIEDDEYFDVIIASAPEGLTEPQRKKWLKERIKSLFLYDKTYPRWIQSPEWPIVNGKPLVFRSQTKNTLEDERVWYTFYDPDTNQETIVMQFH